MSSWFSRWSSRIATISGYWQTFVIMTGICLVWALSGPLFNYSDTWQLVINTATTVLTFLMVFLIQNTQNRDALAVHLKLDELIHSIETADNRIIVAEDEDDQNLNELKEQYTVLAQDIGTEPPADAQPARRRKSDQTATAASRATTNGNTARKATNGQKPATTRTTGAKSSGSARRSGSK